MEGISLQEGKYGPLAVITTAWREEMIRYLIDAGITELELNDGKGWQGNNISFLVEFPHLRAFKIIDLRIASVDSIHFLHELESLEVITYCETELRFSAFEGNVAV